MENESSQQFCLRWHNHQSSVLGGLPALLDSGRLTDVTLCAGGRSLRAHRIVLSTCSPYFMDIFKDLPSSQQPVVLVLGGSWAELCCLVAFMYAGEVTLPRALLPGLLRLAKMLRITGLTDLNGNLPEAGLLGDCDESYLSNLEATINEPMKFSRQNSDSTPGTDGLSSPFQKSFETHLASKKHDSDTQDDMYQSITKNFFSKYLQDSTQSSEDAKGKSEKRKPKNSERRYLNPILNELESKNRKIDKIVENLKFNQKKTQDSSTSLNRSDTQFYDMQKKFLRLPISVDKSQNIRSMLSSDSPSTKTTDTFGCASFMETDQDSSYDMTPENLSTKMKSEVDSSPEVLTENKCPPLLSSVQTPGVQSPTNTKLFATCYICHKQLSNQYNLRVHLETHQNTRHACIACNHISRSRDALRKHVSYRHPQLTSSHGVGRPCKSSQNIMSGSNQTLAASSNVLFGYGIEDSGKLESKDVFLGKSVIPDETENDNGDEMDKGKLKN